MTTVAPSRETPVTPSDSARRAAPRTWRGALRRRPWTLLGVAVLVCVAVLAAGPFVPRRYVLTAALTQQAPVDAALRAAMPTFDDLHDLLQAHLTTLLHRPDGLVTAAHLADATNTPAGQPQPLHITITARDPTAAYVALSEALHDDEATAAQQAGSKLEQARAHAADELAASEKSTDELGRQLQTLDVAHPGLAPDDPTGPIGTLHQTQARLEDRQQRLQMLQGQQSRLTLLSSAAASQPAAAPAKQPASAAQDPQVLALDAQLSLIGKQIDEQLGPMHRTEQHPYVIDLRRQQADLQAKLKEAKARAARGEAPPPGMQPAPQGPSLAEQALTLQRQQVADQLAQVTDEIAALKKDLAAEQTHADGLLPLRRQRQALVDQLAQAQQQYAAWKTTAAALRHDAPPPVTGITLAAPPTVPAFPRPWMVFGVAAGLGLVAGVLAAWLRDRRDRRLLTAPEFAAHLPLPILGTVSEIVTPAARRRRWMRRLLLRPAGTAAFAGLLLLAALFAWRGLAAPHFNEQIASQGTQGVWLMMTRW